MGELDEDLWITPRFRAAISSKGILMTAPKRAVGTCDLLAFFMDKGRFPELNPHGVAFIAAVLRFVNTSGRGSKQFQAYPSHSTLSSIARISRPTSRKWARYFADSGWLLVQKRRKGRRNASNLYDVSPAVAEIGAMRDAMGEVPATSTDRRLSLVQK